MISGRGWIRVEPWYGLLCCGQDGSEDQSGVGGGDCMEREEMQVSVVIALHVLAYLTLWNKLVKCASQNQEKCQHTATASSPPDCQYSACGHDTLHCTAVQQYCKCMFWELYLLPVSNIGYHFSPLYIKTYPDKSKSDVYTDGIQPVGRSDCAPMPIGPRRWLYGPKVFSPHQYSVGGHDVGCGFLASSWYYCTSIGCKDAVKLRIRGTRASKVVKCLHIWTSLSSDSAYRY